MPGPTIIRKCLVCGKHIAQHTIVSGNTFGARSWTDGKRDAPMFPDQPWLVRCPHCSTLVWIDDQPYAREVEPWGARSAAADQFKDARPAPVPTLTEYVAFLSAGVEAGEKEQYVRLRLWWAGNDARRDGNHVTPLTDVETANLQRFSTLLDETNDNDRLLKAEAFRELGMFENAEALLATHFKKRLMQAVEIIRGLNQNRSTAVAEITFE